MYQFAAFTGPGERAAGFEAWLGRSVDTAFDFIDDRNWADFADSARWASDDVWGGTNKPVIWSMPLIVAGDNASLTDAAAGQYDTYYRYVAQQLAEHRPNDAQIYVLTISSMVAGSRTRPRLATSKTLLQPSGMWLMCSARSTPALSLSGTSTRAPVV